MIRPGVQVVGAASPRILGFQVRIHGHFRRSYRIPSPFNGKKDSAIEFLRLSFSDAPRSVHIKTSPMNLSVR